MKIAFFLFAAVLGAANAQDIIIQPLNLGLADGGVSDEYQGSVPSANNMPAWVREAPSNITTDELANAATMGGSGHQAQNLSNSSQPVRPPAHDFQLLEEAVAGLEGDPAAVYDYVRRTCRFSLYSGLSKGPIRTWLDKAGNDLDLAVLLAAMLERCIGSEDSVEIAFGDMTLTLPEAASWLRVPESEVSNQLFKAVLYHKMLDNGTRVKLEHFWVQARIGGVVMNLDPSLQKHERTQGRVTKEQLIAGSAYSLSGLTSDADAVLSGLDTLTSMSVSGVRSYLDARRAALTSNELFSDRRFSAQDLLPGWQKLERGAALTAPVFPPLEAAVYEVGRTASNIPLTWSWENLPLGLKSTIEYNHLDWSNSSGGIRWATADVAEKQVSLRVSGASPVAGGLWIEPHELKNGRAGLTLKTEAAAKVRYFTQIEDYVTTVNASTLLQFPVFNVEGQGSFTVENVQIASGGAYFSTSANYPPVYDGSDARVYVIFHPTDLGTVVNAKITFQVRRGSTLYGPFKTEMLARGTNSPTDLTGAHFGVVQLRPGSLAPVERTCTVHNPGSSALTLLSSRVTGTGFSVVSTTGSISAGGSRSLTVRFKPTAATAYSGRLYVKVKSSDGVVTEEWVALRGIGYDPGKAELLVDGQSATGEGGGVLLNDLRSSDLNLTLRCPAFYQAYIVRNDQNVVLGSLARYSLTASKNGAPVYDHLNQYGITTHAYRLQRAGRFVVPLDFGSSENGQFLAHAGKKLQLAQELPAGELRDEAVLFSTLEMMGLSWYQQTNQARQFLESWRHQGHATGDVVVHRAGVIAQEFKSATTATPAGYYVDVANQLEFIGAGSDLDGSAFMMSAMEHGVLEQMQRGATAASTTRMLEKSLLQTGSTKQKIYRLTAANFSQYRAALKNYPAGTLDSFEGFLAAGNAQSWMLAPSSGSTAVAASGGWKGYGAVANILKDNSNSISMLISGGYNGGYSGDPDLASAQLLLELVVEANKIALDTPPQPSSTEPINLVTGEYYYDRSDVSVGQSGVKGVGFSRHYTSAHSLTPGPLGYGWSHNWQAGVDLGSDTSIAFGSRHALDAATAYIAMMALDDLFAQQNVTHMTLAALVSNWCVDALKNNVANVSVGNNTLAYSNYNNGKGPFYPPPGVTDTLEWKGAAHAYDLVSRDGGKSEFRVTGSGAAARSALSRVVSPDNLAITLTYGKVLGAQQVDKITDTNGRGLNLDYSSTGLISKITTFGDMVARTVVFQYDNPATTKNLIRITDPEGRFTSHEYAVPSNHLMTGLRDGLGRVIAINEYDSQGRAIRQWAYGDEEKLWHYFFSDLYTVEMDPTGGRTTYYFDQQMRTIAKRDQMGDLRRTEYDFNNFPVRVTDAENHEVRTFFDADLRPYRVEYPDGTFSTQDYDSTHRPTLSISRGGKRTLLEYNTGNNKHRPDRVKVFKAENDANPRTTHYTYHTAGKQAGQVATITDPAGRVSTLAYDNRGAPASVSRQVEVDTGSGTQLVTLQSRIVFNARGDLTDSYDERGIRTQTLYNAARQPVKVTRFLAAGSAYAVTTVYDRAGDAVQSFDSMPVPYRAGQTFSAQGKPLRSYRITQDGRFDFSLSSNEFASEQLYDVRDWPVQTNFLAPSGIPWQRVSAVTVPYADGQPFQTTDPIGRTVSFATSPEQSVSSVTDDAGFRVVTATDVTTRQKLISDAFATVEGADPLALPGNVLRLNYAHKPDGELLTLTNRRSKTYTMAYDGYGQIQSRVTPGNRPTGYTYTADGLPETLTRPDNSLISWSYYPESGRLRTQTDPAGVIEHRYDVSGNLTWVRDAATGSTLRSVFDAVGRLQTFTDSRGQQTTYSWLPNGLLRSVRYHAQRAAALPAAASAVLTSGAVSALTLNSPGMGYTGAPVVTITAPPAASGGTTATAVATVANGVVTGLTITNPGSGYTTAPRVSIGLPAPDLVVTYEYYPDRSLAKVTDWTGRATTFRYYQDGRLHSIERPNGTRRAFAYTLAGELALVAESTPNNPAGTVIYLTKFAYNNRGQVSQKSTFPGEPANATSTPPMTAEPGEDNELTTVNNVPQVHDARGNLVKGVLPGGAMGTEAVTYAFDARNRLTAMEGGHSFGYDVGNNRISITTGGVTTELSVAPLGGMSQVISEKPAGGAGAERLYIYTPQGQLLYHLDPDSSAQAAPGALTASYYHYDITGSTVALTGDADPETKVAPLLGRVSYTAYGEITSKEAGVDTRFLFCGAYCVQTDASGLVYMRARYYQPYLCRFLNEDPIEFEGGLNWFEYVGGNPLIANDPRGELLNFVIGAAVNVVVGGAIRVATGGNFFDGRAMAIDAAIGAATSGVGAVVGALRGARAATQIINRTEDFTQVVNSNRLWGMTEGAVYGLSERGGIAMTRKMTQDVGSVVFKGEAAALFRPHEIRGIFSAIKTFSGQYKASFGDIVWNPQSAVRLGNTLSVTSASIGAHAGQNSAWAAARYAGAYLMDVGLTMVGVNLLSGQNNMTAGDYSDTSIADETHSSGGSRIPQNYVRK